MLDFTAAFLFVERRLNKMKIKITTDDLKKGRYDNIMVQTSDEGIPNYSDCTLTSEQAKTMAQFLFDVLKRGN